MEKFKCVNCERLYHALTAYLVDDIERFKKKRHFINEPHFEQDTKKRMQYYEDKIEALQATLVRFADMKKHELLEE